MENSTTVNRVQQPAASGGQGALFEKTAPWTPAKTFDYDQFI
jgi:hypothetical protein